MEKPPRNRYNHKKKLPHIDKSNPAICRRIRLAKGVIVVRLEDFKWRSKIVSTIWCPTAQESKLLYV